MHLFESFLSNFLKLFLTCCLLLIANKSFANTDKFYPKVPPIVGEWVERICWSALAIRDDNCLIYGGTPLPDFRCEGVQYFPAVTAVTNYADIKSFDCEVLGIEYNRANPWKDSVAKDYLVNCHGFNGPRYELGVVETEQMKITARYKRNEAGTSQMCTSTINKRFVASRRRDVSCPENATSVNGGSRQEDYCRCKNTGDVVIDGMCVAPPMCKFGSDAITGNPCNIATGAKLRFEVDSTSGNTLTRLYDSAYPVDYGLGVGWRINILHRQLHMSENTRILVIGRNSIVWQKIADQWQPRADNDYNLENMAGGYRVITDSGDRLEFDANGLLVKEILANGGVRRYEYSDKGKIKKRTDEYGKSIHLQYNADNKVIEIGFDDNAKFLYSYDENK